MPAKLLLDIEQTCATLELSRATVYELIGSGALDARKIASKTVVVMESVERFVASLPKAPIHPQGRRARAAAEVERQV